MFRLHRRQKKSSAGPPPLKMSRSVLENIRQTVGTQHPETGGMLGGDPDLGVVTHFHFDDEASRNLPWQRLSAIPASRPHGYLRNSHRHRHSTPRVIKILILRIVCEEIIILAIQPNRSGAAL
jgi:hypothetical protein